MPATPVAAIGPGVPAAPNRQRTPRAASARFTGPSNATSAGGTPMLACVSRPSPVPGPAPAPAPPPSVARPSLMDTAAPWSIRRAPTSTPSAAATNGPVPGCAVTRAGRATRHAKRRRSSARSSSGSRTTTPTRQPGGRGGRGITTSDPGAPRARPSSRPWTRTVTDVGPAPGVPTTATVTAPSNTRAAPTPRFLGAPPPPPPPAARSEREHPHAARYIGLAFTQGGALQVAHDVYFPRPERLGVHESPGLPHRRREIETKGRHAHAVQARQQCFAGPGARHAIREQQPQSVVRGRARHRAPRHGLEVIEYRLPGEHDHRDQGSAEHQQQEVPQPQAARALPLRLGQVAQRRERRLRRHAAFEQVQQAGDRGTALRGARRARLPPDPSGARRSPGAPGDAGSAAP